jgi:serine/threonine-protein kinase
MDSDLPGLPRCPRHGLAFVDAREVVESGGDSVLGTTVVGRFTVLGRLGAGSMGAVYRARQEAVDRDVALKIVRADRAYDPETKRRFEREARATSALKSAHTVTVYDFGEAEDGSWFLAMELLEGETVGDRLRRTGRVPLVDAVRIAREALKSLAEAHGKGIIHRDLKPDNLFLARVPTETGMGEVCKVLDFGIAKLLQGDDRRVDQLETQAGTVFGTPRYMSPEQAQGAKLDPRTDLYSLGIILYQMICGRPPFVDDDAVVVMARHIKDEPPRFAEVAPGLMIPPSLEALVRRAIQKLPNMRPQSAEQMVAELDAAVGEGAVLGTGLHASWVAPPVSIAPAPRKPRALVFGALGIVGLGALSLIGFSVYRGVSPRPAASEPAAAAAPAPAPSAPAPAAAAVEPSPPAETTDSVPSAVPSTDERPAGSSRRGKRPGARVGRPPTKQAPGAAKTEEGYGRFE